MMSQTVLRRGVNQGSEVLCLVHSSQLYRVAHTRELRCVRWNPRGVLCLAPRGVKINRLPVARKTRRSR
jgi:hypothetical protein